MALIFCDASSSLVASIESFTSAPEVSRASNLYVGIAHPWFGVTCRVGRVFEAHAVGGVNVGLEDSAHPTSPPSRFVFHHRLADHLFQRRRPVEQGLQPGVAE